MQEKRIEKILTYTGTVEEISPCLRKDANGREASMDAPDAYAMRNAAEEFEGGERTEFRSKTQSHYRIIEAFDSAEAGAAR